MSLACISPLIQFLAGSVEPVAKYNIFGAKLVRSNVTLCPGDANKTALIGRQQRKGIVDTTLRRRGVNRLAAGQQRMSKGGTSIIRQWTDGIGRHEATSGGSVAGKRTAGVVCEEVPSINFEHAIAVVRSRRVQDRVVGNQRIDGNQATARPVVIVNTPA